MEIDGKKVYDVVLILRKTGRGSKVANITIRTSKKGPPIKRTFPLADDIYDNDPNYWTSYQGQQISIYHRKDKLKYVNKQQHSIIPPDIGQRLEALVHKATVFKNQ